MNRSVLLTIFLLSLSLTLPAEKPLKEYWVFQDKHTVKILQLDTDGNFAWYLRSCRGTHKYNGLYKHSGDTIVLEKPFKSVCLLLSENKLYTYQEEQKKYSDFQPLTKVSKKEFHRLKKKRKVKLESEEEQPDKINKTAEDVAPFLEILLRGFKK